MSAPAMLRTSTHPALVTGLEVETPKHQVITRSDMQYSKEQSGLWTQTDLGWIPGSDSCL